MSSKHLSIGSEQPPKAEGKLRLYAMEYCPYAQRARLVLLAKQIPHDIVNINLINKPEWITKVHPEAKVPALDTGTEIITESLTIADYLDEKYPEPPLYPSEPLAREQDKALIEKIAPVTSVFYKIIMKKESRTPEEWLKEITPHLEVFENELQKRGTKFFGGNKPGMVDYMLWPWAERAGTIGLVLGKRLPIASDQFPLLRAWRKEMRESPTVNAIYHGPQKFHTIVRFVTDGVAPDYDSV